MSMDNGFKVYVNKQIKIRYFWRELDVVALSIDNNFQNLNEILVSHTSVNTNCNFFSYVLEVTLWKNIVFENEKSYPSKKSLNFNVSN